MKLSVRAAVDDDLALVLAVLHDRPVASTDRVTSTERATWTRMMGTDDLTVYVAEVDGEVAGTATLLVMPNVTYGCAPTAFVEAVHVAPAHRRAGVGSAIMRRLLVDAGASGCDKVQVVSHRRHATDGGHALYESLGFEAEAAGFRRYLRR